jgi:predicted aldo/keto reductase-like oxidoreductase
MFRHNFRTYGDAELSQAIDAAHKAKIGLIAMKAQGAVADYPERLNPFEGAGLSKHQAALRFVWQDERIASICSEMTSLRILEENAAAALWAITKDEARLLQEWANRTAATYCPGGSGLCRRQCETACGSSVAIADTLRFLTYHDSYGREADACRLFAELPPSQRPSPTVDLSAAQQACPYGLPVASLVRRAVNRLA